MIILIKSKRIMNNNFKDIFIIENKIILVIRNMNK